MLFDAAPKKKSPSVEHTHCLQCVCRGASKAIDWAAGCQHGAAHLPGRDICYKERSLVRKADRSACTLQAAFPAQASSLPITRQLIGSLDEVTDVRLIGADHGSSSTHVAVSTNSTNIMMFELGTMSCSSILTGHTDIILALDATRGPKSSISLLASGGKDAQVPTCYHCFMKELLNVDHCSSPLGDLLHCLHPRYL